MVLSMAQPLRGLKAPGAALGLALLAGQASGGSAVVPGSPALDPPTFVCLGIAWPVRGDDNGNASATCEYRKEGSRKWIRGPDLFRVSVTLFKQPAPNHRGARATSSAALP